jgi:hypothetical protein
MKSYANASDTRMALRLHHIKNARGSKVCRRSQDLLFRRPTQKNLSVAGVDGRFRSSKLCFTEFQHDYCLIYGWKIKGGQPGGD